MNTQAIDAAKNSLQRIRKYLERFEVGKGYCKECIHSFIDKDGDEIPLLVADLKALLQQVATTSSNTDAKDAARYRWLRNVGLHSASAELGSDLDGTPFVCFVMRVQIPEPISLPYEEQEWDACDTDAAIDAALAAQAAKQGERP